MITELEEFKSPYHNDSVISRSVHASGWIVCTFQQIVAHAFIFIELSLLQTTVIHIFKCDFGNPGRSKASARNMSLLDLYKLSRRPNAGSSVRSSTELTWFSSSNHRRHSSHSRPISEGLEKRMHQGGGYRFWFCTSGSGKPNAESSVIDENDLIFIFECPPTW